MGVGLTYNPAIDGLRAVAVLLVIAFHCRVPGVTGSFVGVDIFFVISGFLITRLLVDELSDTGRIDLGRFYLRRFLRLAPALGLMVAVYLALAPIIVPELTPLAHLRDAVLALLYLSDYSRAFWDVPVVLRHTWSLSVEEHYYLVWPLVIAVLIKQPLPRQVTALLVLYLAAVTWRVISTVEHGWTEAYYRFDTRLSGLLLGSLLGLTVARISAIGRNAADVTAIAALVVIAFCVFALQWGGPAAMVWGLTLVELASAGLLVAACEPASRVARLLSFRPIAAVGLISYGLYLWHFPVAFVMRDRTDWTITLLVALVLSGTAATLSYYFLERPLLAFRRSLARRGAVVAAGTS